MSEMRSKRHTFTVGTHAKHHSWTHSRECCVVVVTKAFGSVVAIDTLIAASVAVEAKSILYNSKP